VAYDKGDFHFDDAGSWEKACRHIALFLYWASERGLTNPELHPDSKAIAKDPVQYFIGQCDAKLWNDDFSDAGNAVAEAIYDEYLGEIHAYAEKLGVSDYDVPDNARARDHFFRWLDERVRARGGAGAKTKPPQGKSKPKRGTKGESKPAPKKRRKDQ
jgi:hypothetical protein